ncbi:MAG: hypothetical protein E7571_03890 [Ruminococcaceae bacterium]|nr:hypothetical protein [Oscillospiraceae bacterium]
MKKELSYHNPIGTDVVRNIRDPFILLDGDTYYLTGTIPPYWNGKSEGVKLWKSSDLLHWEEVGFILHRSVANADSWYRDYWWAPEIHKKNGRFYLTVNCRNDELGVGQNPLLAVSDRIDGDYTLINADNPLFTKQKCDCGKVIIPDGNDANLFTDSDGKTYITVCSFDGIFLYEIDLDTATLIGKPTLVVAPSEDGWDTKNEGQFIICHGGKYYCFYSSFTRSYEVGVAVASSIHGPWVKDARNPIITPIGVDGLQHSGHNSVFSDKKGQLWTAYHITMDADPDTQLLAIDRIDFDKNGNVITDAPTL